MSKVILKFHKPHGPYVKGDIAGFEPEKARKLSSVARPYDEKADAEMEAAIAKSAAAGTLDADLKKTAEELAERAADLKAREDALSQREAAADAASDNANEPEVKKPAAGDPPAQGKTAAKK